MVRIQALAAQTQGVLGLTDPFLSCHNRHPTAVLIHWQQQRRLAAGQLAPAQASSQTQHRASMAHHLLEMVGF